jgi:cellulose synthase/poly-beta-1,6-N-acetylglucosamine synthase-like glycosyltransferase
MLYPLTILWLVVQFCVWYNLVYPLFLYCVSLLTEKEDPVHNLLPYNPDYAIIVTAYQYTDTLPQAVSSILKLNYSNYLVYVVADNCDTSNLHFDDSRVILLKPETVLQGNVRSHFYAIDRFKREHDLLTIIDSDNLVHPEYLNELNVFFEKGIEAVQGVREAKNLDTTYACLDAARDIYYHYYDGRILYRSGSSATLSGSGMAFTTALYKECLQNKDVNGAGFDKVLQAQIVKRNKRIAFAPAAIVYDEKTSRPEQLVNQRSRWINTWFKYFAYGFMLIDKGIKLGSVNCLLFGLTLLRPPLFFFLVTALLMMVANIFLNPWIALVWLLGFFVFIACFFKAIMSSNTDRRIYKSLTGIPTFIFYQLVSLTKIRKANIRSVSTKHYHT